MQILDRGQDAAMFITVANNGLFFNLVYDNIDTGDVEQFFFRTSYPFSNIIYPFWVDPLKLKDTEDFFKLCLDHFSTEYSWQVIDGLFWQRPFKSYGNGVTNVKTVVVDKLFAEYPKNYISQSPLYKSSVAKVKPLHKSFEKYLKFFNEKVVIVTLDFYSLHVVEFVPKQVKDTTQWQYKITKLEFNTPAKLLNRILKERFLPLMGSDIPRDKMYNMINNWLHYKTATTSEDDFIDLIRSIYSEIIIELIRYTDIFKTQKGFLFITGEVPAFLNKDNVNLLMAADTLGFTGVWAVYIDKFLSFRSFLTANDDDTNNDDSNFVVPINVLIPYYDLWVAFEDFKDTDTLNAIVGKDKMVGIKGSLFRYSVDRGAYNAVIEYKKDKIGINLFSTINLRSIILDGRDMPVEYGPYPVNNANRLRLWLQKLDKML